MKRFIAAIVAVVGIAAVFTGCGKDKITKDENGNRISAAPIDEAILGTWKGESTGYCFQDDRTVSLIMEFGSIMGFTEDGGFAASGQVFPKEQVVVKDNTVRMYEDYTDPTTQIKMQVDFLNMTCDGPIDTEHYYGHYTVNAGGFTEVIANNFNVLPENLKLEANISEGKFEFIVVDFFNFETIDGSLQLFSPDLAYTDENATSVNYNYEITGDNLKLTYEGSDLVEVYTKAD